MGVRGPRVRTPLALIWHGPSGPFANLAKARCIGDHRRKRWKKGIVDRAMDAEKIAAAVKVEIERQQANVDYNALATEDLERVIASLNSRLALCNGALEARGAAPVSVGAGATEGAAADAGTAPYVPATKMMATSA